jgi:nicotinamidase-related amidase
MTITTRDLSKLAVLSSLIACATPAHDDSQAKPRTLRALYGLAPPTSLERSKTALLLLDFQQEFFLGALQLPDAASALEHAKALLSWARREHVLVVHVQQLAKQPDSPVFRAGSAQVERASALALDKNDWLITKSAAGAFTRTDLDARLRERGIRSLVIAGLMTHLAVDSSARDATLLGYSVIVASDATATRDLPSTDGASRVHHADVQRVALASLADRFADVATTQAITSWRITP